MWLHRTVLAVQRPLAWYWSVRTFGGEHVPPDGPLIVAPNHASFLDPFLVSGLFPRRPIRWLTNERWFRRSPLWTAAFRACAVIEVSEGDPRATIDRVVASLRSGEMVGIFPEGRVSDDGRLNPGRPGIGRIAALTGVPVVPCGLRGTHESLPRHRRLPRRVPIHLHIGEPLVFPGAPAPRVGRAEVQGFVDEVMERVAELVFGPVSLPGTDRPRSVRSAEAVHGSGGSPAGSW